MLTREAQIIPYVYVQFWLIALQMLSLQPALSSPSAPPNLCVGTSFLLILTNAITSCWYSSWASIALITSSPPQAALPHLCCIQCEPLLLAFKACHPSVGVRHSPVPGFASAAHFTFLSSMLLSWPEPRASHMSKWSSGDSITQVLWHLGLVGSSHAPPGLHLKKIKGRAFGAHEAKGHHKWVWTWGPRHGKVVKRLTYW